MSGSIWAAGTKDEIGSGDNNVRAACRAPNEKATLVGRIPNKNNGLTAGIEFGIGTLIGTPSNPGFNAKRVIMSNIRNSTMHQNIRGRLVSRRVLDIVNANTIAARLIPETAR